MTRWLPWLAGLLPELFCEISPELAQERGIQSAVLAHAHTGRWWLGGAAAGGLVPALGIAAGVNARPCAALALAGAVGLRYGLLRDPMEGPATPLGPGPV